MGKHGPKSLPRHYYTPAATINIVNGVDRKAYDTRRDVYSGTAEALEAAGVIHSAMLPAPGHVSIAWRPQGVKKEPGESWFWVPGYVNLQRQRDGTYRALFTVSREEQASRAARETLRAKQRERALKRDALLAGPHPPSTRPGEREYESLASTVARVRQVCGVGLGLLKKQVQMGPWDDCSVSFSTTVRNRMLELVGELEELVSTGELLPVRRSDGERGHLRLVHSA